jgi:eukaryotic-like serine/threonine-protein kinase
VSPAEVAGGRYTLQERIAAGGMGEVWRATDTSLGRTVAIKLLRENIADDDAFRSRFASEAQHAASLHDPHIATVFDYGDEVDPTTGRHTTYLVMELVNGKPLSELITRPIAPDQAALLIAQAADGLAVAHAAGIVHRDVKPANFLVTPDGKVKVTDFGVARARGAASVTDTGMILGTPHYVAPEVAEGHEATPSSDLYSLGVVLYEALTATRPFDGETPIAIALAHLRDEPKPLPGTIPPPLRSIVESTMARDPARRPPDAATLAAALRRFADDPDDQRTAAMVAPVVASTQVLPTGAPATAMTPTSGGDPTDQTGRRRNAWLPIAAAVLAVLLIVGIAYAVTQSGDDDPPTPAAGTQTTPTTEAPSTSEPTTTSPTSPTTPTTTSTTPTTTTVTIDPESYLNRPVKDVEKELKDLGLEPVRGEEVTGGEKDTVADISPTGEVPEGTQVTLAVYTGEDEEGPGKNSDENGHGPKPSKPKEN